MTALLLMPQTSQAQNLLNTATSSVPQDSASDGNNLDVQWLGASFTTTQTYTVTSLGFNGGVTSGSIFLALVPANTSPSGIFNTPDLPLDNTLSDAVYHAAFTGPTTNTDLSATTNFVLPAGTYDLMAGSGAFGTSGEGFVTQHESLIGTPTLVVGEPAYAFGGGNTGTQEAFYSDSGSYHFTGRFFVAGVSPAVPEASTTVSLGVMLGLGGLALAVMRARRRSRA